MRQFVHVIEMTRHAPGTRFDLLELFTQQESFLQESTRWTNCPRWYHATDILSTYPILIYQRPNYTIDLSTAPEKSSVTIVDTPLYDISSTEIRKHKKLKKINPDVLKYIRDHHLYNF